MPPFLNERLSEDLEGHSMPGERKYTGIVAAFSEGLAPCFGDLECESFKSMDRALSAAVKHAVGVLKAKQEAGQLHQLSWDSIVSIFSQSHSLKPSGDTISEKEHFQAHDVKLPSSRWWVLRSKDKRERIEEFMTRKQMAIRSEAIVWFNKLLNKDPEVYQAALNVGHIIEAIKAVSFLDPGQYNDGKQGSTSTESCFVDVGVLRIPDISEPFVQLYRIKLTAYSNHNWESMVLNSGISGEYMCRRYEPRTAFKEQLIRQCLLDGRKSNEELLARATSSVRGC